jgi:hypothetical protein
MAFYQLIHDEFVTMQKFIFSYSGTSLHFFLFLFEQISRSGHAEWTILGAAFSWLVMELVLKVPYFVLFCTYYCLRLVLKMFIIVVNAK